MERTEKELNEEHFLRILEGIVTWNEWRRTFRGLVDLQYADLQDANLYEANLFAADLSYADLRFANLCNVNLQYADLHNAKKAIVIEAEQWFEVTYDADGPGGAKNPHLLVDHYRKTEVPPDRICTDCGQTMFQHGWIDTYKGGHVVCPGDWIIVGVKGERYPCKPCIFTEVYCPANTGKD